MATQIVYAANERDEAHFDVYIQDVASGVRQCVYQGDNIVTVRASVPMAAKLALLHDRGYGDMSLLVLDVATGEASEVGEPTNWQSVRWASDGRTLLALTDLDGSNFVRPVPDRSGHRRIYRCICGRRSRRGGMVAVIRWQHARDSRE